MKKQKNEQQQCCDDDDDVLEQVRFDPNGCVWTAILRVHVDSGSATTSSSRERMVVVPLTITCCTHDNHTATASCYSIELSYTKQQQQHVNNNNNDDAIDKLIGGKVYNLKCRLENALLRNLHFNTIVPVEIIINEKVSCDDDETGHHKDVNVVMMNSSSDDDAESFHCGEKTSSSDNRVIAVDVSTNDSFDEIARENAETARNEDDAQQQVQEIKAETTFITEVPSHPPKESNLNDEQEQVKESKTTTYPPTITAVATDTSSSISNETTQITEPPKKSILQLAQDLSSSSSDEESTNGDKWNIKIQQRRMQRQQSTSTSTTTVQQQQQQQQQHMALMNCYVPKSKKQSPLSLAKNNELSSTRTLQSKCETEVTEEVTNSSSGTNSSSSGSTDGVEESTSVDILVDVHEKKNDRNNKEKKGSEDLNTFIYHLSTSKRNLASRGLLSKHSIKRMSTGNYDESSDSDEYESDYESQEEIEDGNNSHNTGVNSAEMKHANLGLMGKHSRRSLLEKMTSQEEKRREGAAHNNSNLKTLVQRVTGHEEEQPQPHESYVINREMKQCKSTDGERRAALCGVLSQKSKANLMSSFNSGTKDDDVPLSSDETTTPPSSSDEIDTSNTPTVGELRSARRGIMSHKSMAQLTSSLTRSERANGLSDKISCTDDTPKQSKQRRVSISEVCFTKDEDSSEEEVKTSSSTTTSIRGSIRTRCLQGKLPMSTKSFLKQKDGAMELARELMDDDDDDDYSTKEAPQLDRRSSFKNRCLRGQLPMSSRSLLKQGKEADDLAHELLNERDDDSSSSFVAEPSILPRHPSGELRSFAKGISSRATMLNLRDEKPKDVSRRRISFDKDTLNENSNDNLVFSNHELEVRGAGAEAHKDILTEGQTYLGISMLVYMYSHLRETVKQGFTRVRMEDIDVQSCQSQYNSRRKVKYLSKTRTAGSIIRVVIDELDAEDENDADHELLSGEGKEYEKSQTAQFRKWIEDSKVSQYDKETEEMIVALRHKVARHRWRRAISAVRLSYKLSGKRPEFNNPVIAPGCENENRFVDLNQMMSDVVRKQPKYFKEGSIMDNLIESGIEVVWFSDLTQNDVVYGICCQREEKKVTVVFRGTVNSHNWSMNLKFDTNEYRNPIKTKYPGREDELSLHSGFALYLMRRRKDTGLTKMQEIFNKVDAIGREICPEGNYKLSVTGHSLGGALATLFGFYVATKPMFSHLSRVYIWTYASPRVGCNAFFHAYQYLERIGRIRHARFSNTQDIVPLIPFCNFEIDDLQFYQHVGMRVQLHNTGRIGKMKLRHALDVTYPLRHDWLSRLKRVFMNNIFANLTTLKRFGNNHTPAEMQRRLLFSSHFKQALASGAYFADNKRNKIKSLDEYYSIRAQMHDSNSDMSPRGMSPKQLFHREKLWVLALVALLMLSWLNNIATMLNISSNSIVTYPLIPFRALVRFAANKLESSFSMCVVYIAQLPKLIQMKTDIIRTPPFIPKTTYSDRLPATGGVVYELAQHRARRIVESILLDANNNIMSSNTAKLVAFDNAAKCLLDASSSSVNLGSPIPEELVTLDNTENNVKLTSVDREADEELEDIETRNNDKAGRQIAAFHARLTQTVESKAQSLREKATGITFEPKLEEGLYLVGVGVRKKSIINIYAVAMYSSPEVIQSISAFPEKEQHNEARAALRDAARTPSQATSFILSMVYKADAKTIAAAISDSLKSRYTGPVANAEQLEAMIREGVQSKGGYATKGTILRFDCSTQGVGISIDGNSQGHVMCKDIGKALIDVFTDDHAVSPQLIENCIESWSKSGIEIISEADDSIPHDEHSSTSQYEDGSYMMHVETMMQALTDKATGVTFAPKLDDRRYLVGVGVRKKSIINIYAVAMYSSPEVIHSISEYPKDGQQNNARIALRDAARAFESPSDITSFILSMVYKADANTIAAAISDSVKSRYTGPIANIEQLESLISQGVQSKGGYATKGTILQFDCSVRGVSVTVDGKNQGDVPCVIVGGAFVDVFMDDQAVSPRLVDSCIETWAGRSCQM